MEDTALVTVVDDTGLDQNLVCSVVVPFVFGVERLQEVIKGEDMSMKRGITAH